MSNYFENFRKVDYDIDGSGDTLQLTDITLRYRFKQALVKNRVDYYTYTVRDGERPDTLAHKYYGHSKYAWLVYLANDIVDPYHGWVMSHDVLVDYIKSKYGSFEYALTTVHHYEQIGIIQSGVLIKFPQSITLNKTAYDAIKGIKSDNNEPIAQSVTILEHEQLVNEEKRNIKLIDRSQLQTVMELVKDVLE